MPTSKTNKSSVKKIVTKKTSAKTSKKTKTETASDGIFSAIQKTTGVDNGKINDWQEKWLAMPDTRKKYEQLSDTPEIVGEELFAMANDIIDFIQKEENGQSVVFKKISECADLIKKDPVGYLKNKAESGKNFAFTAKNFVGEKISIIKEMWYVAKERAEKTKEGGEKKITKVKNEVSKPKKSITKKNDQK